MSRYSKLRHELIENINSQVKFGQSKHEAKKQAIKETHEKGGKHRWARVNSNSEAIA